MELSKCNKIMSHLSHPMSLTSHPCPFFWYLSVCLTLWASAMWTLFHKLLPILFRSWTIHLLSTSMSLSTCVLHGLSIINYNYMYINFLLFSMYKSIFRGEFYLIFVLFDIRINRHIELGIRCSSSSMRSNALYMALWSIHGGSDQGAYMQADINCLASAIRDLLFGHVDTVNKNQYLHMRMGIAVLRYMDAIFNHINIPFIYYI